MINIKNIYIIINILKYDTFRSNSGLNSLSIRTSEELAWWQGDGVLDTTGLLCKDGESSKTGTLLKCSVGIRIFVKHLAQIVRLHREHTEPRLPQIPNLVLRHKKHNFRFSTSSLIWIPTWNIIFLVNS